MTRQPAKVRPAHAALAVLWVVAIVGLIALGTWQVQRRAWKLDLIAQVEARLRAAPVDVPTKAGPGDAYRRVILTGVFVTGRDSFVQASTVRGPGWWVMTPMRRDDGRFVFVNRGYVPERRVAPASAGRVIVTGLLRLTEPGGGFLRSNDPAADRWFSRDVAAMAARRGVGPVAPYFIDADGTRNVPGQPVGGLTVISFPNNHLVYAITWYILAIMTAAGFYTWIRLVRRRDEGAVA